jgi:hypothetical protein
MKKQVQKTAGGNKNRRTIPQDVGKLLDEVAACASDIKESLWSDLDQGDNPELFMAQQCDWFEKLPGIVASQPEPKDIARVLGDVRSWAAETRADGEAAGLSRKDMAPLAAAQTRLANTPYIKRLAEQRRRRARHALRHVGGKARL